MIPTRTRSRFAIFAVPLAIALLLGVGALRTPSADGELTLEASLSAKTMKLVKIFWKEPDYCIHGTGDVESLGSAASHGCLRMDPDEAAEVALMVMENAGQFRDWDWVKGILHLGDERAVRLATATPITVSP